MKLICDKNNISETHGVANATSVRGRIITVKEENAIFLYRQQ